MVKYLILIVVFIFTGCMQSAPTIVRCGMPANSRNFVVPEMIATYTLDSYYYGKDTLERIQIIHDSCNSAPQLINDIKFSSPEIARRAGVEGSVILLAVVNQEGNTIQSKVILTDAELFNQSAINGVKEFRFKPLIISCKAEVFSVIVSVSFKLVR